MKLKVRTIHVSGAPGHMWLVAVTLDGGIERCSISKCCSAGQYYSDTPQACVYLWGPFCFGLVLIINNHKHITSKYMIIEDVLFVDLLQVQVRRFFARQNLCLPFWKSFAVTLDIAQYLYPTVNPFIFKQKYFLWSSPHHRVLEFPPWRQTQMRSFIFRSARSENGFQGKTRKSKALDHELTAYVVGKWFNTMDFLKVTELNGRKIAVAENLSDLWSDKRSPAPGDTQKQLEVQFAVASWDVVQSPHRLWPYCFTWDIRGKSLC